MNRFVITIIFACFIQLATGQSEINKKFLASKGTWELPVRNGSLMLNNNFEYSNVESVTILTDSSRPVTAVFEGTVRMVDMYDSLFLIVVKSGGYFVGYSNLATISIEQGDQIKQGDLIGFAGKDLDGEFAVNLMVSDSSGELKVFPWFKKDVKKH